MAGTSNTGEGNVNAVYLSATNRRPTTKKVSRLLARLAEIEQRSSAEEAAFHALAALLTEMTR